MVVLGIDPGPELSAYCLIDEEFRPRQFGKLPNLDLLTHLLLSVPPEVIAIEWIENYGMTAGQSLFTTARWVGRFEQFLLDEHARVVELVPRRDVKLHLCGSSRAKDVNVKQVLIDRFAPFVSNHGKGTKREPGWFHGFSADCWQACALAVTVQDRMIGEAQDAMQRVLRGVISNAVTGETVSGGFRGERRVCGDHIH